MSVPLRCHWYESGAVPLAATVNVAGRPALTVWFVGCVVIVGAWLAVYVPRKTLPPEPRVR
jgi:hypothetical protein